ncbi:MAG: hypothetical protein F4Y06_11415 [Rhodospirillales bacterium]|nr:hypothetical protein [Rhodospirillales bacterium]
MDAAVLQHQASTHARTGSDACRRPRRSETEVAVRMSIEWAGDDPDRKGLNRTPERVGRAWGRGSKLPRHPCPMVFSPC